MRATEVDRGILLSFQCNLLLPTVIRGRQMFSPRCTAQIGKLRIFVGEFYQ